MTHEELRDEYGEVALGVAEESRVEIAQHWAVSAMSARQGCGTLWRL